VDALRLSTLRLICDFEVVGCADRRIYLNNNEIDAPVGTSYALAQHDSGRSVWYGLA
jgi:hypothetical protein